MAKTKISEYDSTAANNTDIDSINIAEGCPPSGLNNALRAQMSHLKDGLGAGTPVFLDQTNNRLGVGNAAPATALDVTGTVTADGLEIDKGGVGETASFSGDDVSGARALQIISSTTTNTGDTHSINAQSSTGVVKLSTNNNTQRLAVFPNGDISFYEDTGTTPKLFWDASAESLQIGDKAFVTADANVGYFGGSAGQANHISFYDALDLVRIYTGGTERMRIDSSGNLLVGRTTHVSGNEGVALFPTGLAKLERDSNPALIVNTMTNDGDIALFQKDGSTVGSIGANSSSAYFVGTAHGLIMHTGDVRPCTNTGANDDNSLDLGASFARFDDVFATNGTIQTSDENEKQDIASLTSAEITAATAISKLFKTYKWKDKVAAKGDDARTHTGVVAQQVQTAMSDAGLDASKYAFWCSDTWTNDDGNEQTRMGVRYPELLAFVGAATEQRLANIETRLTALEG